MNIPDGYRELNQDEIILETDMVYYGDKWWGSGEYYNGYGNRDYIGRRYNTNHSNGEKVCCLRARKIEGENKMKFKSGDRVSVLEVWNGKAITTGIFIQDLPNNTCLIVADKPFSITNDGKNTARQFVWSTEAIKPLKDNKKVTIDNKTFTLHPDGGVEHGCTTLTKDEVEFIIKERQAYLVE
jgi:hypothetical protein